MLCKDFLGFFGEQEVNECFSHLACAVFVHIRIYDGDRVIDPDRGGRAAPVRNSARPAGRPALHFHR